MLLLLLLVTLWALAGLCHLNSLPPYRRQNPCHLPEPGRVQRCIPLAAPLAGCVVACGFCGLDGLFLWGFSAPLTGFLLGLASPLLGPGPPGRPSSRR